MNINRALYLVFSVLLVVPAFFGMGHAFSMATPVESHADHQASADCGHDGCEQPAPAAACVLHCITLPDTSTVAPFLSSLLVFLVGLALATAAFFIKILQPVLLTQTVPIPIRLSTLLTTKKRE